MSGNQIAQLTPMFEENTVLCELDLSNNEINRIDPETFQNLKALTNLNLSYNPFTNLPFFDGLKRLYDVNTKII